MAFSFSFPRDAWSRYCVTPNDVPCLSLPLSKSLPLFTLFVFVCVCLILSLCETLSFYISFSVRVSLYVSCLYWIVSLFLSHRLRLWLYIIFLSISRGTWRFAPISNRYHRSCRPLYHLRAISINLEVLRWNQWYNETLVLTGTVDTPSKFLGNFLNRNMSKTEWSLLLQTHHCLCFLEEHLQPKNRPECYL